MENICSKMGFTPNVILITIPMLWGLYEFRKFLNTLNQLNEKADFFKEKIAVLQMHLSNISNKEFDNEYQYPFLIDLNRLIEKTNTILK
tara:strand:- start:40 stop:306 length:267 start_codon:yes stop_codon:yes gene_type:complete